MKNIIIYHNPRCSKSRQALQILHDKQIEPTIIEYLKTPLSPKDIAELLKMLAMKPQDLMRKNEDIYKAMNLKNEDLTDKELIQIMSEHPILIERPIVVINKKAFIARPPEKLLELL